MSPRIAIAACCAIVAITIGALVGSPGTSARADAGAAELAGVRAATARYHVVSRALRDGYVPVGHCEEEADGAMGIHYLHPQLASDTDVDPRRPEILTYEPQADGPLRLVSVEWFVADADQDLATDADRPSVLGHEFDGPMLGHEPGMPVHYDLHAWVWRPNPLGSFAKWNPKVACP
jgi:hypothetical protein